MSETVVPWRAVEPLPPINGDTEKILATVDTLRAAWDTYLSRVSPEVFESARLRTLRRHAIETGIIERLYDVEWGVTQALVAEGITREAAAREGLIAEDTLAIINSQLGALELLVEAVRDGRPLSLAFIKELHAAITRHQATYEARDQFGRFVHRPLEHGTWKDFPNDVLRADGSRLEYVPPEQVQSQMEVLLAMYGETVDAHPVVRSAWIHHRFVRIHPFRDGNGRVARALSLLTLLQAKYAPLVIDRSQRAPYIDALDAANDGDLRPLVRLFGGLEIVALKSELSPPISDLSHATGAVGVARELVDRMKDRRQTLDADRAVASAGLAADVHQLLNAELLRVGEELAKEFHSVDDRARANVSQGAPGQPNAHYWRGQIIHTAKRVDFFANIADGSWWTCLHLNVLGQALRYLAIVQKVGYGDIGVLAVTTFAEVVEDRTSPGTAQQHAGGEFRRAFESTPSDSVTLVHTDTAEDRWPEVAQLVDRTLAAGVRYFVDQIGG